MSSCMCLPLDRKYGAITTASTPRATQRPVAIKWRSTRPYDSVSVYPLVYASEGRMNDDRLLMKLNKYLESTVPSTFPFPSLRTHQWPALLLALLFPCERLPPPKPPWSPDTACQTERIEGEQ